MRNSLKSNDENHDLTREYLLALYRIENSDLEADDLLTIINPDMFNAIQEIKNNDLDLKILAKAVRKMFDFPEFDHDSLFCLIDNEIEKEIKKSYHTYIHESISNDRTIFIQRDNSGTIVGMNFIQGIGEHETREMREAESDQGTLDFYNGMKDYPLFKNMDEMEKVNQIMWLKIQIELLNN